MFSLANFYSLTNKLDEATNYFLQAIDNGHQKAMFLLALMFYMQNQNKLQALQIADKFLSSTDDVFSKSLEILMLLWKSELMEASGKAEITIPLLIDQERIELLTIIINELLVHIPYNLVWQLFNNEIFGNKLRELISPLYYVSAGFLGPKERGEELLKPGPEISESIEKLREEIIGRQKIYS
jgi:hypothetical protein